MAEIRINSTGELKLYDSDDSNYVSFKSAGTVSSNVAWVLPSADGSSGQMLSTDGSGTLSWATASSADPSSADGDSLGTASAEWSDLFLADGGTIKFGNDQDVILTHVADTALLLNAAMRIQFRDSGLYIGSNADGDLDIVSDGTAVDSINLESAGGITLDAGTAGSGIIYEDDGTEMARIHNSSSDVIIESKVSDKDIIIKGNDGGSTITAATFDMSNAGELILPGGINFPDTQVASGDGNTLDDYEEGTFTPAITFSSSTGSLAYNTQYGRYTKIGNMVTVWCTVYPSGGISSGSSGTLRMSVPFTCINDTDMHNHGVGSIIYDRLSNSADHFMIQPFIVKNTAYVQIAQMQDDTSGAKSELGQGNMVDNTYIHFSLCFGV